MTSRPLRQRITVPADAATRRLPPLLVDLAAGRAPCDATIDARVVALANEHRMTGLLWSWARENVDDTDLKRDLAKDDLFVQAHLARVWDVLEKSVALLTEAGIEVATIKGVTSEARWYRRSGDRPCSDVDLVLSPAQLDRAADAVRLLQPDHPWVAQVPALAAAGRLQSVTTRFDGLEVDLHLDVLKLGFPTRGRDEIWAHTVAYRLPAGSCVRVLDDTATLLQLLVHLNKDRFQRLLGYADIAMVIRGGRVTWPELERLARVEGIDVSVLRTLEVVLDELSLPWPSEIDRPRGPRAWVWDLLWRRRIRLRGNEGRLRFRRRQDWITLLARGRALEAVRWWWRESWPAAPVVAVRYADVRGPYLWKLTWGRLQAARALRRQVDR